MALYTVMYLSDTVRCLSLAVAAPHRPGVRILNAVGGQANVAVPIPDLMHSWYGEEANAIDVSHYERPGHERDPVYRSAAILDELGFAPRIPILPV